MSSTESARDTAISVVKGAINSVLPESAVKKALTSDPIKGSIVLVAIGKAAWRMAAAAYELLSSQIARGCVITKDGHSMGAIGDLKIFEAAHPVLEERNLEATRYALSLLQGLTSGDTVLFLVSGGGSALFELPLEGVSLHDEADMTSQLLACGADIVEINTLRKHISAVKGGRFALACKPAKVRAIVLSDVLGDRLDSIASGPAYPDSSTVAEALAIVRKYNLRLPKNVFDRLEEETPKSLANVYTQITGSVPVLCAAARDLLKERGYETTLLTTTLNCEASAAGSFFAAIAREAVRCGRRHQAFIAGGETVVKISGHGKGGRCQEMALTAALGIAGLDGVVFLAAGSDGTDGPTDAAGGVVDGASVQRMHDRGVSAFERLEDNDAYNALAASYDLLITGPTGTNVNDLNVLVIE